MKIKCNMWPYNGSDIAGGWGKFSKGGEGVNRQNWNTNGILKYCNNIKFTDVSNYTMIIWELYKNVWCI